LTRKEKRTIVSTDVLYSTIINKGELLYLKKGGFVPLTERMRLAGPIKLRLFASSHLGMRG